MASEVFKTAEEILSEEINMKLRLPPVERACVLRAMVRYKNQEKEKLRTKLFKIIKEKSNG